MKRRWLVLAATLFLSLGCSDNSGPTAPNTRRLDEPFSLRVGEQATIPSENLGVGFNSVSADYRCPIDVVCVWSGDADVLMSLVRLPNPVQPFTIRLYQPNEQSVLGYRVKLLELNPPMRSQVSLDPRGYTVKIVVSRLEI